MHHWINVNHVQFELLLNGLPVIQWGKMIKSDDIGFTVLSEIDGKEHSYPWHVLQQIQVVP